MSSTTPIYPARSRAAHAALWLLQIAVAFVFFAAGISKLAGDEQMIAAFGRLGLGQWFRYATGLIEVSAALLLLVPRLIPAGALLLVCTMIGAVATHLLLFRDSPLVPFVLLLANIVILYGRRERLARLVGGN